LLLLTSGHVIEYKSEITSGHSLTSSLRRFCEAHNLILRWPGELGDVKEEVHGLRNMVKLLLQRSEPGISPEEIEVMLRNPQHSPVDANSGHGSTHAPNIHT
ncbi:hypothetical protein PIB30_111452, partial [Stylosanthes scabra]|nr:hypothetical protein [Stylosanthes scabra]